MTDKNSKQHGTSPDIIYKEVDAEFIRSIQPIIDPRKAMIVRPIDFNPAFKLVTPYGNSFGTPVKRILTTMLCMMALRLPVKLNDAELQDRWLRDQHKTELDHKPVLMSSVDWRFSWLEYVIGKKKYQARKKVYCTGLEGLSQLPGYVPDDSERERGITIWWRHPKLNKITLAVGRMKTCYILNI